MSQEESDFLFDDDSYAAGSGDVTVEELTWSLIDDQIDSGEFQLLESLLLSDDAARRDYVNCMQLHTDLRALFAPPQQKPAAGSVPILGCLGEGVMPFDTQPSQS